MLHNANYSLRRLNVPNELIRRVECRLDLHHLKPEDEMTGAAALSPEVRSCDPTSSRSSVLAFTASVLDLVISSQFLSFQLITSETVWFNFCLWGKFKCFNPVFVEIFLWTFLDMCSGSCPAVLTLLDKIYASHVTNRL